MALLLQRIPTPLESFVHSVVCSFIQLFLEHLLWARHLGRCHRHNRDQVLVLKYSDLPETEWDVLSRGPESTEEEPLPAGSQGRLPGKGDIEGWVGVNDSR